MTRRIRDDYDKDLNNQDFDEIPVVNMKDIIGGIIDLTQPDGVEQIPIEDLLGNDFDLDGILDDDEIKKPHVESVLKIPTKDKMKQIIPNHQKSAYELEDVIHHHVGVDQTIDTSEEEDNVFFIKKDV